MPFRMEANYSGQLSSNHTNYTTTDHGYNLAQSIAMCIILGGIIITTIIGNTLVCVCIFLVRKLRRPCNYLLVSLAVSDLCVAILVMPMALIYEICGQWIFGDIACNLWVSLDVLSCTSSILNLCMISVDRYYAITKPLEYGVKRTPRRMILWIVLVWCLAAMISLPPLLILGNEHSIAEEGGRTTPNVCLVSQHIGYQVYATMCSFYIPLTVMILVYYKIFRAARRIVNEEKKAQSHLEPHCYLEISVKNGEGPPENKIAGQSPANCSRAGNHRSSSASTNTVCSLDPTLGRCFKSRHSNESQCPMLSSFPSKPPGSTKLRQPKSGILSAVVRASPVVNSNQKKLRFQLAKERKASTTLGIIMSAFIFCWLPFFVLALIRPFFLSDTINFMNTLSSLFLWLGYTNSLLNPIIYATLNRDFRKPFKAILYFRCGSLNHMMREDFYHSQFGDPEHNATRYHMDYEEGVEYIEAEGEGLKVQEIDAAHESFL